MIKFGEQLNTMILHEKITHVRIKNFGKKVCDCYADTPEELIKELEKLLPSISSFGKLNFIAGTVEATKNNFAHAAEWLVSFEGYAAAAPKNELSGNMPKEMLALHLKVQELENEKKWEAKFKSLEEKIEGNDKGSEWLQYAPFITPMLGIKDDDLLKRMQLSMMFKNPKMLGNMMGQNSALAGAAPGANADADTKISAHLDSISKKIPADTMLKLVAALDTNPAYAQLLVGMLPAQQPAALAGADEKKDFKATSTNPAPGLYLASGKDDMN